MFCSEKAKPIGSVDLQPIPYLQGRQRICRFTILECEQLIPEQRSISDFQGKLPFNHPVTQAVAHCFSQKALIT